MLSQGGSLNNQLNGFISGGTEGALVEGIPGTVTNTGTINGVSQDGVELVAGGSVNNLAGGLISGGLEGVFLDAGGSITNQNVGTISGGEDGIQIVGTGGSVTNGGMISGTSADRHLPPRRRQHHQPARRDNLRQRHRRVRQRCRYDHQ